MLILYNLFAILTSPIWVPWMIWRAKKRKESPDWRQRMGDYRNVKIEKGKPAVWIHAVSVGEVVAALPILKGVRQALPGHHIVLSVTTSSGHQTAREQAAGLYDSLTYMPIDLMRFQLGAMMRIRPDVVAIMETELWMSFLWAAKSLGATTLLINGRISDRSFPRSMRIRFFYRALLKLVDRCLMQTDTDKERISALGGTNVEVLGNTKFDQAIEGLDADPNFWRSELGIPEGLPVIVVGSTRSELEERIVGAALVDLEGVAVVWAPRHIERAEAVGVALPNPAFRSKGEKGTFVVLDTYGELAKIYSIADIVIIGGGFDELGGQNLIQPLAHGCPVIHGPHMQNFREVAVAAGRIGATRQCDDAESLRGAVEQLLRSPEERQAMAEAGRQLVRDNLGASDRYIKAIVTSGNSDK